MEEQEMLPNFPEAMARAEQSDIDTETTQLHLCRWFARFGKYQKFCKDPKFQERCEIARHFAKQGKDFEKVNEEWRFKLCSLMGNTGRKG